MERPIRLVRKSGLGPFQLAMQMAGPEICKVFMSLLMGNSARLSVAYPWTKLPFAYRKAYPIGTKVVLIGRDGDLAITTTDVAVYRGTINYEVVCVLSDRVPRVYRPTKEDSGK